MNRIFANKYLPFKEQDSQSTLLLLLFVLFPFTALFPHAHLFAALFVLLFLAVFVLHGERGECAFRGDVILYSLFLALSLSGCILPSARWETLLSACLRLSYLLPALFYRRIREGRRIFSLLAGLLGLLALLELALGHGATGYDDPSLFPTLSRASFPFGNPNILAAFLLPLTLLSLRDAIPPTGVRPLFLLSFLLGSAGIAASYSRGALLSLFLAALFLLIQRFGAWRTLLSLFAFLPLVLLLLPSGIASRLSSVLSPDTSVLYRFSLWRSVFRLPLRTLLFGIGEGKEALLLTLSPVLSAGLLKVEHTHSLYLHLLLSTGVFGFLLFFLLVLRALVFGKDDGARAGLLALLLFGIFDDPLYSGQTEVLFWFLLGISAKKDAFSSLRS